MIALMTARTLLLQVGFEPINETTVDADLEAERTPHHRMR